MVINRRRAPSSKTSSEKKINGHKEEALYAKLIGAEVIKGTQKGDVKDKFGNLHSVKSGKKWQVFLYGYHRISSSKSLKVLLPCLNAFPVEPEKYFEDRTICIAYKENFFIKNKSSNTKPLDNVSLSQILGVNSYILSKENLAKTTQKVCDQLSDKKVLREFLDEALFNNKEVKYLSVKDSKDGFFKVFTREYVLTVLMEKLSPSISSAGRVPVDYNVAGQKTLLRYQKKSGTWKNIVEIEIRNDEKHYRQVRFNMYSIDALFLLLNYSEKINSKNFGSKVKLYLDAADDLKL
jgi:hypothetical protein